ncbi:heparinase II/III family protein [Thiotrichales bacterium 19S9-12]|nr:heparinase II/III family protein [Thiotrichales bacterium 19S9-11]MCF6810964.1 heparinase II/III family protein [Thiotrichales bacterium 19S9-12]
MISLKKILLYYHTIKYLKFKQIFYRIYYKFYRPKVAIVDILSVAQSQKIKPWCLNILHNKNHFLDKNTVSFLNKSKKIDHGFDWNDKKQEKLWLYNLHYFEGFCSKESHQKKLTYQLLLRWIKENEIGQGNGWEPYPISLRIVNIIKYVLMGNEIDDAVKQSLYTQARFLNKICEYHILGNHLFENFKALCFAGLFFDGGEAKNWFKKGFNGLSKQIKEQILSDGGHFELSPMYHSIILEGLLDLKNIFIVYGKEHLFCWDDEINNMLNWLQLMMRNCNSISYFNDASDGIAPEPQSLFDYAQRLGFLMPKEEQLGLIHLSSSNYLVFNEKRIKAIFDLAEIGPNYLPGHAHADNLSFELVIDGYPVFVNLGTSCYGSSKRRNFERSTQAHNTLVMENENSSNIWSSFRVAQRAKTKILDIQLDGEDVNKIVASHNGYQRIDKKAIHQRQWQFDANSIIVTDSLAGSRNADILLHLHPACELIKLDITNGSIKLPNQQIIHFECDRTLSLQDNLYANTFGQLLAIQTLCYKLDQSSRAATTKISWDD